MAKKLSVLERRKLAAEAVRLSSRGVSYEAIADRLNINPKTVRRLVAETVEELADERDVALAESLQHHREIIATCWRRVGDGSSVSPHGLAALLNTASASQKELDKLRGVAPPEKLEIGGKLNIIELARATEGVPPEDRIRLVG